MIYHVCYDITNSKRRREVAKSLERYGVRIQKSMFEISVDNNLLKIIEDKLHEIICLKSDKLYFYPKCSDCNEKIIKNKEDIIQSEHKRYLIL